MFFLCFGKICNIFQQTSTIINHRSEVWVWCLHCLDWPPWASRCQCRTLCIWSADAHQNPRDLTIWSFNMFQYDPLTITDHHWSSLSFTIIHHHSASFSIIDHGIPWKETVFVHGTPLKWHHGFRSPLFLRSFARCGFSLSAYGMTRPGSLSFGDSEQHSHGATGKCSGNCCGKARNLLILSYFVIKKKATGNVCSH